MGPPETAELGGEEVARSLLRQAMADYPQDPERGDFLIQYACTQTHDPLSMYRAVYKFYNRQRLFDLAGAFALRALAEAGRQGRLPVDPKDWTLEGLSTAGADVASNALLALKAASFIAFRRGDPAEEERYLALLSALDPEDGSGVSVVSALAESLGG